MKFPHVKISVDNVTLVLDGVLYIKIVDPYKVTHEKIYMYIYFSLN